MSPLLDRGVPSDSQCALMMSAIIDNSAPRAAKLLAAGFDVNHIVNRKTGASLLHSVIGEGDRPELARLFIDHGINVEHANALGDAPLIHAICSARIDTMKVLLDAGACPDRPGHGGNLPLRLVMQLFGRQGADLMRVLLSGGASCKRFLETSGESALEFCVKGKRIECIKALLSHGQDPDAVSPASGQSPLTLAQQLHQENVHCAHRKVFSQEITERSEVFDLLRAWSDAKAAREAIDSITAPLRKLEKA